MSPLGMVRLLFNVAALLGQLINPSMFCSAMSEEDTKSNSHPTYSQPAMSEDDAADENVGNSNGATQPMPSLEEGIADAAPAATPAAAPSTTPAAGRISTENRIPAPGNSSKSIADAIISAGDKHAALLRDLVEQFSSSRQVYIP